MPCHPALAEALRAYIDAAHQPSTVETLALSLPEEAWQTIA